MPKNTPMEELLLFLLYSNNCYGRIQRKNVVMLSEKLNELMNVIKLSEGSFRKHKKPTKPPKRKPLTMQKSWSRALLSLIKSGYIKEKKEEKKRSSPRYLSLTEKGVSRAARIYQQHRDFVAAYNANFILTLDKQINKIESEFLKKSKTMEDKKLLDIMPEYEAEIEKLMDILNKILPFRVYIEELKSK